MNVFEEEQQDSCIRIELNHGKVNAMDLEFCKQLIKRLNEIQDDSEIQAVILQGNGRVFSAGIDLKRWLAESPDYAEELMRQLEELFETVFCFPKPVISAINGHAIAGGCMLATASDFRVINSTAKIGILESRLGVALPMTAIEIVRHVANPSAFRRIISVGATFVGSAAVAAGLVDVATESDFEPALAEAVKELTAIPAAAFKLTKKQVRRPIMRIVEQNKKEMFEEYLEIWRSPATRNAIATYVQQRLR